MADRCIDGASVPTNTENKDLFVDNPGSGWFPDATKRLHSLMNLHEIPIEDIVQTFSPWKVRPRKSEEDSR